MTELTYFVHDSAYVDEPCSIGEGTKIWHFCHVMAGARIGRGCVLGQGCFVAGTAVIGDNVRVQNNVSIYDGVTLEDEVFVGPSCVFTNVRNPHASLSQRAAYESTLVRRGATLGANATIRCRVTVGQYAFVGAGAVVTRDVPDHQLVVGAPARGVGWVSHRGQRLSEPSESGIMACPVSGREYRLEKGALHACGPVADRPTDSEAS
jgi:UDP-2-acetamido-3-amino-2,3-dideoxy-glucuronate N-acetyltransferase